MATDFFEEKDFFMETIYKVSERTKVGINPAIIHVIKISDSCARGGWYRQIMSIEAMKSRLASRLFDFWNTKRQMRMSKCMVRFQRVDDTTEMVNVQTKKHLGSHLTEEQLNELFPVPREIHHDSVWDFFEHIGYDYKNRKVAQLDAMILREPREASNDK